MGEPNRDSTDCENAVADLKAEVLAQKEEVAEPVSEEVVEPVA